MRRLHRRVKQLECIASENTFRDRNKQKIIAAAATDAEDDKQALQTSTHTHTASYNVDVHCLRLTVTVGLLRFFTITVGVP